MVSKLAGILVASVLGLSACKNVPPGDGRIGVGIGALMGGAGVATVIADNGDKKEDTSLFFSEMGAIYRGSIVKRVRNVPEYVRNLPPHHADPFGKPGPIAQDQVEVGPRAGGFLRFGPRLGLADETILLKAGLEIELSGAYQGDFPERNYTNAVGTDRRGYGAALTYYSINTKSGPIWNSIFFPKLFVGAEAKISDGISLGLGYKIWREDLVATNGYDRHDKYDGVSKYKMVDMTLGSLVASVRAGIGNGNFLFLEVGTQDILDKKFHKLGREADVDFNDHSLTVSLGGGLKF